MDQHDAFLSYSHMADGALAPAVKRGMERLAKPMLRRRTLRVFRDETGLSANPDLWRSIESALDSSDWFVLLASTDSAASPWVSRELEHWLRTKSADRILIAVTDGDVRFAADGRPDPASTNCLPPLLMRSMESEPRWIDLRWARTAAQVDLSDGRFRSAIADLVAPMHGVPKDDLESEDLRLQRRTVRLARAGVATIALLGLAASILATVALRQRSQALDEQRQALATSLAVQAKNFASTRSDLALLLAVEGALRADTPDTRAGLLTALEATRNLVDTRAALPPDVVDVATPPNGDTFYVLTAAGELLTYSAATLHQVGPPLLSGINAPGALEASSDGAHLLVTHRSATFGPNDSLSLFVAVIDLRSGAATKLDPLTLHVEGVECGCISDLGSASHISPGGSSVSNGVFVIDVATQQMIGRLPTTSPDAGSTVFLSDDTIGVYRGNEFVVYAFGHGTVEEVSRIELNGLEDSNVALRATADGRQLFLVAPGQVTIVDVASLSVSSTIFGAYDDVIVPPTGPGFGLVDGSSTATPRILTYRFQSPGEPLRTGTVDLSNQPGRAAVTPVSRFIDSTSLITFRRNSDIDVVASPAAAVARTLIKDSAFEHRLARPAPTRYAFTDVGDVIGLAAQSTAIDVSLGPAPPSEPLIKLEHGGWLVQALTRNSLVAMVHLPDPSSSAVQVDVMDARHESSPTTFAVSDRGALILDVSPDGREVAMVTSSGDMEIHDVAGGSVQFRRHVDADGGRVAEGSSIGELPRLRGSWSTDGSTFHLFFDRDGKVVMDTMETSTWTSRATTEIGNGQLASVNRTQDGASFLVASNGGDIAMVGAALGGLVEHRFSTADGQAPAVMALSPKGDLLVVVDRTPGNGRVKIIDTTSGRQLGPNLTVDFEQGTYSAPGSSYWSDAIFIDERTLLLSGWGSQSAVEISLDLTKWEAAACATAGRNLTPQEWTDFVGGRYRSTCPQYPAGT